MLIKKEMSIILKKIIEHNMENPFESGHIKNYLLLYASIVVIMVLFFIASTLFNDVKEVEQKVFNTEVSKELKDKRTQDKELENSEEPSYKSRLKLMDKSY